MNFLQSFFLGTIVTSLIWAVILYFYINSQSEPVYRLPGKQKIVAKFQRKHSFPFGKDGAVKAKSGQLTRLNGPNPKDNLINDNPDDDLKENWHDNAVKVKVLPETALSLPSPATLDLAKLGIINNAKDKQIKDEGLKKHAFNVLVSNRIGNRRTIPDTRDPRCKAQTYGPIGQLPNASVIICFYNEAISTLLRTVYSVIQRTNTKILKEIILVDDFSDDGKLKFYYNIY